MTSTATRPAELDLTDPMLYQQGPPHEIWTRLRRDAPISWHDETERSPGFWIISKYDDVVRISRDPHGFISSRGVNMGGAAQEEGGGAYAGGRMMLVTDPPDHVKLRRLVNKGFTPRRVAALEPHIRELVRSILDGVVERGECDFVTDISAKLPVAVICEMMGVPEDAWQMMFDLTNRMIGAEDPEYQIEGMDRQTAAQHSQMQMFGYFAQMLADRRKTPANDLMTVLSQSEIDGERLSDQDILIFAFLLIIAGNETTRNATSGGMLTLMQHPEQHAKLLADPSLLNSAIEEMLRWVTPVIHFARTCTADTEIRGQKIKAGERIVMFYPSANRDEDIFPDPFTFDIARTPNDHLAFGMGEHFCLGSNLARLEMQVVFEELLRRLPDMEQSGDIHRLRSNLISGIKHMPVKYTPTRAEA
jgi:cytochrome P450